MFDIDKILNLTLNSVYKSIYQWSNGQPKDESALMNQITSELNRRRRNCDVGVEQKVSADFALYQLHRKGNNQKDLYGSDLAVTLYSADLSFIKTSLFQFKKASSLECTLEKSQIEDAYNDISIRERAFIFCVDEDRYTIRLKSIPDVYQNWGGYSSKKFRTRDWNSLSEWMIEWLKCKVGKVSQKEDTNSIENRLATFVIKKEETLDWSINEQLLEQIIPSEYWLLIKLNTNPENKLFI